MQKITKNSKGKTPPELSQAVTAAAWAIERGDLKKGDIANIKNAGGLKARVDAIKPDVVTKTSPELQKKTCRLGRFNSKSELLFTGFSLFFH